MSQNHKTWTIIVIALVAVVVLAGLFYKEEHASQGIKIGAVLPMTGWGAYWSEGELKGIELARRDIAAQGGKVSILTEDGNTDAGKSVAAAQKLVSIDGVQGMFVEFTGPSTAVAPVAAQSKIPMIYDALAVSPLKTNPYAFKFYFDMEQQCYLGARYLVRHGAKKVGGLILNLDFSQDCQNGMKRATEGTTATFTVYSPDIDTVDFRTWITKMKQDSVDAVLPVLYEDNAFAFFKQRAEMGFMVPVVTGDGRPDGFTEKVTSGIPASALEGVITYDQNIHPDFVQKLTSAYPDINAKDILEAAFGYDESMYLYTALKACGSNADCVKNNLIHSRYQSALDTGGFGENRVLKLNPIYYIYTHGKFKNVDINN